MLDIILLKIKKNLDLDSQEQEQIFLKTLESLVNNHDEVRHPFIKLNLEHLLSGYISEEEFMSENFIEHLASLASRMFILPIAYQADGVYFMVRYLLAKRKEATAMRYSILFLHQLDEKDRSQIDQLTLDYLEYFATEHSKDKPIANKEKALLAKVYSGLEKQASRKLLTPEFLENPFHPHFAQYDPAIHRILAISSLAELKSK